VVGNASDRRSDVFRLRRDPSRRTVEILHGSDMWPRRCLGGSPLLLHLEMGHPRSRSGRTLARLRRRLSQGSIKTPQHMRFGRPTYMSSLWQAPEALARIIRVEPKGSAGDRGALSFSWA
jgi:hypothetical protein